MRPTGPNTRRRALQALAASFGLVASGGCVDKTPPPLWPTPPPPPMATPIGVPERPQAAAGQGEAVQEPGEPGEPASPLAPETELAEPGPSPGPWQPAQAHR